LLPTACRNIRFSRETVKGVHSPNVEVERGNAGEKRGVMSKLSIFMFARKWNEWYRVLRNGKGFGPFESMRYGLWLARG
jgi:hypothetical protein